MPRASPLLIAVLPALISPLTPAWPRGPSKRPEGARETVFLLHGMGRTRLSMAVLGRRLRRAGYATVNVPYNQARMPVDGITTRLVERIERRPGGGTYHLIGHSLGNVIIRNGFRRGYPPGLGRVVMLAPPNHPAPAAVRLRRNPLYRLVTGDSGQRLADEAFYDSLPAPDIPFGVIAGSRGPRRRGGEPNDMLLPVRTTRLEGMADFAVVRRTHTFMMNSRETFELCLSFLRTGSFGRATGGRELR